MESIDAQQIEELSVAARSVAKRAYAAYSGFRVGAAVLAGERIFAAANVENASLSLSLCAERAAFAKALSEGETRFLAIAVACIDAKTGAPSEIMPCGACRQWMQELAPAIEVIICSPAFEMNHWAVDELFPHPFALERVSKYEAG